MVISRLMSQDRPLYEKNAIALQARLHQGQGHVMDYATQVMSVNGRW